MTLRVEDGTGVSGANAYVDTAFVLAYLTDRNRETENSWSTSSTAIQEGAIAQATDFIEQRWGLRFMGRREFRDISAARGTLTLTAQPSAADIVTIGSVVYTFDSGVDIGADIEETIDNLVAAVTSHADVTPEATLGDTMTVVAKAKGTPGNSIVTTTDVTGASWTAATLLGGGDVLLPQALSFPRFQLFDREGLSVLGIPNKLKFATAEYSVRALSSSLIPDPVIDETGRAVFRKRDKVGPLEEERWYEDGATISHLIHPYPAADRLLAEYVTSVGRVVRG